MWGLRLPQLQQMVRIPGLYGAKLERLLQSSPSTIRVPRSHLAAVPKMKTQ
jgi:hypothetical protein